MVLAQVKDGTWMATKAKDGTSDPILSRMVEDDKTPWYRKPNLRRMYVFLFMCCMGIEMTSGFDSQLINTLQFSTPFNKCKPTPSDKVTTRILT